MIKKTMLVAALAALVAFAVPAAANAAEFTHEGETLEEPREAGYTATIQFTTAVGGWYCPTIHAAVVLEPGGMGTVTGWDSTGCTTTSGFPMHVTAENLPWTVDALSGSKAEITGVKFHNSTRNPLNTKIEVATNVITGDMLAVFGSGGSATLSPGAAGMFLNGVVPISTSGHMTSVGGTQVGSE